MKLELKHLAPYLPYGLNWYAEDNDSKEYEELPTVKINLSDEIIEIGSIEVDIPDLPILDELTVLPILRPMSDLVKNEFEEDLGKWIGEYQELHVDDIDYGIVKNYFKHHFDVFGLIEKGLAIDMNTI